MKNLFLFLAMATSFSGFSQTNWTLSNTGLGSQGCYDFAIAPNGNVFTIGAHQTFSSYAPDLYKSVNNGNSWSKVNIATTSIIIPHSIVFSGNRMLMTGETSAGLERVFASTDSGQNWTVSSSGIPTTYLLGDMTVGPDGFVYLAGSKPYGPSSSYSVTLLKSTDNGVSWTEMATTGLSQYISPYSIQFDHTGRMFLSGGTSQLPNRLYTSPDKGSNWNSANAGIPTTHYVNAFALGNGPEIYIACTEDNGSSVLPRVMKSTDNGSSWFNVNGLTGLTGEIGTFAIINANGTLLMSGYGYSSTYFVHKSALPIVAPNVSTDEVSAITDVDALCGGNVLQDGGAQIASRGICWSTSPNPTTADQTFNAGTGLGAFSATMSGLIPLTTYYVKAFATNSSGTRYGSEKTFTTAIRSGFNAPETNVSLEAYPVPATDFIYVPLKTSASNSVYTIIDASGRIVLTTRVEQGHNGIDIRTLPKGCYLLQDEAGRKQKFVKE